MKRYLLSAILFLLSFQLFSQEKGIDIIIDEKVGQSTGWFVNLIFANIDLTDEISIPWVLIVLVFGAIFFSVYFKLINFTGFFTAINIVRGKYDKIESEENDQSLDETIEDTIRVENDKDHHGEVSHFQALTAALSATVGLGNIAGVAVALSIGGPGATFWMIISGLTGMAQNLPNVH